MLLALDVGLDGDVTAVKRTILANPWQNRVSTPSAAGIGSENLVAELLGRATGAVNERRIGLGSALPA